MYFFTLTIISCEYDYTYFLHQYAYNRYLHSFPTRRSSDLGEANYNFQITNAGTYDLAIKVIFPFWDKNNIKVSLEDRKSTRLNSSHVAISYAVFCLKKKNVKKKNNNAK